ncbi:hypothetical protein [Euzebya sp.]|uniref:hypothetical protein n=1 Tax=Euzebya sp. TaxID=1971409 RepID=UPI00351712BE
MRNSILDVEAEYVTNSGAYPEDQDAFEDIGLEISDPSITLTYVTNDDRSEFCVEGRDARLPADAQVAHYVSGSGVQIFEDCPEL